MNLIKQNVWIKSDDSTADSREVEFTSTGWRNWLKPIEQVYPLTKGELLKIISDAMSWIDDTEGSINDNAEQFLNSITQ